MFQDEIDFIVALLRDTGTDGSDNPRAEMARGKLLATVQKTLKSIEDAPLESLSDEYLAQVFANV